MFNSEHCSIQFYNPVAIGMASHEAYAVSGDHQRLSLYPEYIYPVMTWNKQMGIIGIKFHYHIGRHQTRRKAITVISLSLSSPVSVWIIRQLVGFDNNIGRRLKAIPQKSLLSVRADNGIIYSTKPIWSSPFLIQTDGCHSKEIRTCDSIYFPVNCLPSWQIKVVCQTWVSWRVLRQRLGRVCGSDLETGLRVRRFSTNPLTTIRASAVADFPSVRRLLSP